MAPPWRQQYRATRAEHMRARLLLYDINSTTARRASWQGTEEWLISAHRTDDPLNRHAVRHQPLLHGRGMPDPIPPRRLVYIGAPVSARKGYEKIGIIRARQHPGHVGSIS